MNAPDFHELAVALAAGRYKDEHDATLKTQSALRAAYQQGLTDARTQIDGDLHEKFMLAMAGVVCPATTTVMDRIAAECVKLCQARRAAAADAQVPI